MTSSLRVREHKMNQQLEAARVKGDLEGISAAFRALMALHQSYYGRSLA
jgi:hypothetical protein